MAEAELLVTLSWFKTSNIMKRREILKDALNFKEIINLNVKALNGFGYITPDFDSKMEIVWFSVRSMIFVGFIYIGMMTSEIVNMVLVAGDMEKMTEASFLTLTHLVEICKVFAIIKHRNRIKALLCTINRAEFQPKNFNQRKALKSYIQSSKLNSKVFLMACVVTCCFWGVYPYADDGDLRLPLAGWFPFNTEYSPWFEVAYVYQVIASTVNGLVNVSLDTFISGKKSSIASV